MITSGTDSPNSSSAGPAWMPNAPTSVAVMMFWISYVFVFAPVPSRLRRLCPQSSAPRPNENSLSPSTCDALTVK